MIQEIKDIWSDTGRSEKNTILTLGVGVLCLLTGLGIVWGPGAVFIGLGVFLLALGFNYS